MKKKILFIGEGVALAHVVRPLYLAKCLDKNIYDVSFACSSIYKKFIDNSAGNYFEVPSLSPEVFYKRMEKPLKFHDKKDLTGYIESELELFSKLKPDIVVGDLRISLAISARQANIPYVNLVNAYWSPFSTQERPMPENPPLRFLSFENRKRFFDMFLPLVTKLVTKDYSKIRVKAGLSPVSTMQEMYCGGDWNLYADVPTLAPTGVLPEKHEYIGPITGFINNELPDWWNEIKYDKPIVYFSIGSTGNMSVLKVMVNVLKKLPVTVIMVTAGKIKKEELPEDFFVADYLPALSVIEKSDFVICNGGSGSIYQALSKGKPVLALPTNMDQFLATEMVEKTGVGKSIRPNGITETLVIDAIKEILNNSCLHENLKEIQKEIEGYDVNKNFLNVITRILK